MTVKIQFQDWERAIQSVDKVRGEGYLDTDFQAPFGDGADEAIGYMLSWRLANLKVRLCPNLPTFPKVLTGGIMSRVRFIYSDASVDLVESIVYAISNADASHSRLLARKEDFWITAMSVVAALYWYDSSFVQLLEHLESAGLLYSES